MEYEDLLIEMSNFYKDCEVMKEKKDSHLIIDLINKRANRINNSIYNVTDVEFEEIKDHETNR